MPEGPLLTLVFPGSLGERTMAVVPGESLLDALVRAGAPVASDCGGNGVCGKCKVRIQGHAPEPDEHERAHLTSAELDAGQRLACRVRPEGPLTVDVSGHAAFAARLAVRPDAARWTGTCVAAVDIGTTGLKMELADPESGRALVSASMLNPQRVHGHDVMSRIHAARDPEAAADMAGLVRGAVSGALRHCLEALGAAPTSLSRMAVSGNTVMLHLFQGLDVTGLGRYPYPPVSLDARRAEAAELGLEGLGRAEVLCLPAISAYLGGDLVAGLLSLDAHRQSRPFLLMDLGTNSEIILSGPDGLAATSCAAGPAIEGMNLSCGMTAAPGAVDDVRLGRTDQDADARFTTIDDAPALGLCGSGIISLLAELVRAGVVDAGGRMVGSGNGISPALARRVESHEGMAVFHLTDAVRFTQGDVRQVQLAKGAILSGLRALLERTGVAAGDVGRVCIAGEFGRNLELSDLLRLGFLDPMPGAEHVFIGNSSLAGARMTALDPDLLDAAETLARTVQAFPLSTMDGYQDLFVRCLAFPPSESREHAP